MVLNKNIHKFDRMEERIQKKQMSKRHSFKERIKRINYLIDAKLFEDTYKDEYQRQNVLIERQNLRIINLERKLKKYEKEQVGRKHSL